MDVELIEGLTPAPEVWAYVRAVVRVFNEDFEHLDQLQLICFLDGKEIVLHRRLAMAYVAIPQAQGQNRRIYTWALQQIFGFDPDVILVCSEETWKELDPHGKAALVYHELSHVVQKLNGREKPMFNKDTGRPVYELQGHDVEEFYSVAARFGDALGGLTRLGRLVEREDCKVSKKEIKMIEREAKSALKQLSESNQVAGVLE